VTWDQAHDDPGVREGDVLAGKYRVDEILGIGGMGVVVAAHHLQLDDKVAIKFLLPHALRNEEAVARFQREARAAVKIKSEHVARIIDVGTLDSGAPYMVMEHLDGCDLDAWLHERGPLDPEQAVEFVLHACEAMAEAHALGIVHRDLKPANLLCIRRRDGLLAVKVLDFGISKVVDLGSEEHDPAITKTQSLMGSPMYMSPEQLRSSKHVDARADIWSLGVVLHELIAGHPPFSAETMPQLVLKVMSSPAPGIREARADVPEGLERVILRCLEKDKEKRYPTVAELAAELGEFGPARALVSVERVSRVIQAAGMSAPPPSANAQGDAGSVAPWMQPSSRDRGKRRAAAAVAATVAVTLVVGALLFIRNRPGSTTDETGSATVLLRPPSAATRPTDGAGSTSMPASAQPLEPAASASAALSSLPATSASASAGSASAAGTASAPPTKKHVPRNPPVRTTRPSGYDPLDHL